MPQPQLPDDAEPRRPRLRLGCTTILLVIVVGLAAAFASAPWFAFRALKSAAQNHDVQALTELIDYDAVRTALRSQIRPSPVAESPAPSILEDPIGAVRRALQQPILQPQVQVDDYLTPEALSRMTDGRPPLGAPLAAPDRRWPSVIYWDVARCRIAVKDPAAPARRTVFTWQRRGLLEWKLVQIRLPTAPDAG